MNVRVMHGEYGVGLMYILGLQYVGQDLDDMHWEITNMNDSEQMRWFVDLQHKKSS